MTDGRLSPEVLEAVFAVWQAQRGSASVTEPQPPRAQRMKVVFRKTVSDQNYGHESAELSLEYDVPPGEDHAEYGQVLLAQVRHLVHAELTRSPSIAVRRALNPAPRLCSECELALADEEGYIHAGCDEERQARRKREDEERQAKWNAERVAAALAGAGDDDADDDEADDEDEPL
jgi:hypothetical protein